MLSDKVGKETEKQRLNQQRALLKTGVKKLHGNQPPRGESKTYHMELGDLNLIDD